MKDESDIRKAQSSHVVVTAYKKQNLVTLDVSLHMHDNVMKSTLLLVSYIQEEVGGHHSK